LIQLSLPHSFFSLKKKQRKNLHRLFSVLFPLREKEKEKNKKDFFSIFKQRKKKKRERE
jgi:hypothetical protein